MPKIRLWAYLTYTFSRPVASVTRHDHPSVTSPNNVKYVTRQRDWPFPICQLTPPLSLIERCLVANSMFTIVPPCLTLSWQYTVDWEKETLLAASTLDLVSLLVDPPYLIHCIP